MVASFLSVGTLIRHLGTLMPFWGGATIPLLQATMMAICSIQTVSPRLTALSDNCIGIMVGDGARFGVACDPLSIPIRAITPLNASLIFQSFSHADLVRIPKKCASIMAPIWPISPPPPARMPLFIPPQLQPYAVRKK